MSSASARSLARRSSRGSSRAGSCGSGCGATPARAPSAGTMTSVRVGRYVDLLRTYVGPQRRSVVLLAMLLIGSIGLQLLGPQLLRYFIDSAIGGVPLDALTVTALQFVGVALAN